MLAICADTCTVKAMTTWTSDNTNIISVTDAASKGVPKLVREAESGHDVVVSRRNRPVAVVISMARLAAIEEREGDLRDLALVLVRAATDDGQRTSLDDAITALGFDRAELEAKLDAELAANQS